MFFDVRRRKLVTAVLLTATLGIMPVSQAQITEGEVQVLEEVIVIGSRIARTTFDTPAPVTVIESSQIQASGATNIGEFLARMPQMVSVINNSNSSFNFKAQGLQVVGLHNLGTSRTLVLLNGKRFVSGMSPGYGYAVDLNAIPTALIQRVEILTGGTSAVYGSDALAGVVNIILMDDFEGTELKVQGNFPEQGDRYRQSVDLAVGKNFERGNLWGAIGYDNDDGLQAGERDFSSEDIAYYNAQSIKQLGLAGGPRWDWLGSVFTPAGRFGLFQGDGSFYRNGAADRENSDAFNRASYRELAAPVERAYFAGAAHWALNNSVELGIEANYSQVESQVTIEPEPLDLNYSIWQTHVGGAGGLDVTSSPLLDGNRLRSNLLALGITDLNQLGPGNTARRLTEFGPRGSDIDRRTTRLAVDAVVDLDNGWSWKSFLTWGETDSDQKRQDGLVRERTAFALDVTYDSQGKMICVSETARDEGCVPFDIFGANTISPEVIEYLSVPQSLDSNVQQTVIGTHLSGDTGWELAAGPIAFSAGLEYREEKGSEEPGAAEQLGIVTVSQLFPTDGEYDVAEVYGEVRLPIHDLLTIEAAARYGDYSTVGGNTSWKIGLESLPTYAVRFRATISESVRAPNVAELYAGASEVFFGVADACDGIDNSSTGNTAENCRSIPAIQQRIDEQGAFVLNVLEKGTTAGFQSGNPELSEETAESWTLGVVWTPERLENLSVAMDWYDIEIEDAIRLVDRATVVSRCYGVEPSLFDPDCGGRTIRYDGNGVLIEVNNSVSNEDDIDTSGLDIEVSYFLGLNRIYSKAGGQFSLGLLYSYLHEFEITEIASGLVDDDAGEVLYPEHRLNLSLGYTYSDLTLSWRIAYIDESVDSNTPQDMNENSAVIGPLDDNANTCSATTYHDVQAAYEFGSVEAYLGVNNLLDEAPCVLGQFTQYGSPGTNTNASMYDVTGREYYAGLRVRF